MSDFGLKVTNDAFEVLIDGDRPNPKLIYEQDAVLGPSLYGRNFTITLPTPTKRPIIATGFCDRLNGDSFQLGFDLAGVIYDGTYYRGVKGYAGAGGNGEIIHIRVYEL